jgi:hypothetical protein
MRSPSSWSHWTCPRAGFPRALRRRQGSTGKDHRQALSHQRQSLRLFRAAGDLRAGTASAQRSCAVAGRPAAGGWQAPPSMLSTSAGPHGEGDPASPGWPDRPMSEPGSPRAVSTQSGHPKEQGTSAMRALATPRKPERGGCEQLAAAWCGHQPGPADLPCLRPQEGAGADDPGWPYSVVAALEPGRSSCTAVLVASAWAPTMMRPR